MHKVLPKSKLGKAVQYSLAHQEELQAFLEDGNAALSNNICERAIRNFTIGRKNWLFSDSPERSKGQRCSLQHHRDGQGQWPESVSVPQIPLRAAAECRHPAASRKARCVPAME